MKSLAKFIEENLSGNSTENFSLCLPADKFKIKDLEVIENEEGHQEKKLLKLAE